MSWFQVEQVTRKQTHKLRNFFHMFLFKYLTQSFFKRFNHRSGSSALTWQPTHLTIGKWACSEACSKFVLSYRRRCSFPRTHPHGPCPRVSQLTFFTTTSTTLDRYTSLPPVVFVCFRVIKTSPISSCRPVNCQPINDSGRFAHSCQHFRTCTAVVTG